MNPSDLLRITATVFEGISQVRKVRADGIVTVGEVLEMVATLTKKSELDTLVLARANAAPVFEAINHLIQELHPLATKEGEVTFGDLLHAVTTIVAQANLTQHPLSRRYGS